MAEKPIDLASIRDALAELDRLAKEHPELCGNGPTWTIEEVEEIVTPTKDRMKAFRERRAADGYRRITFYADPQTHAALCALRTANTGKTVDEIISAALALALQQSKIR